jgi:DNA-binding Lrp family transcriptional regulator
MELDALDRQILGRLANDARQTNRQLAAAVHVSPSTSLERVRQLREAGVIRRFRAELDLTAIGRPVQALIAIRIRPPSRRTIEAFREWARALPDTIGVFVTSGDRDFLLHVAVADTDGLYAFVIDELTQRPEVADVETTIVYEHLQTPPSVPSAAGAPGGRSGDLGRAPG